MNDIEKNIRIFRRYPSIQSIEWDRVSLTSLLPETFIHDNSDFLNWNSISRYQKLSIEFMITHSKKVVWHHIVKKYDLPEVVINHFYEQFDNKTRAILAEKGIKYEPTD